MNVVLVMFKDQDRRDFPLKQERTIIGRRQDCDLRIPTKDVSRQHCELLLKKNSVLAKDLGSSNGTFVNGKRIAEVELKAGDRFRVGPVTFIVQIAGKPATIKPEDAVPPSTMEPAAAAAGDEATFELSEADFDLDAAREEPDDERDMP
jgi:pSer/pThr/pTyr-binding forkhead associated (FHA) protein